MKSKYIFLAAMSLLTLPAMAQETYENARLLEKDLNGTARYVGMGGAMEALGADISTISTNPAGLALFRRSAVSMSFGGVLQHDAYSFANGKPAHPTFDQIGGVYTVSNSEDGIWNIGFNYHKSRDFNYLLSAGGALNNGAQNKLSYGKVLGGMDDNGYSILNLDERNGILRGKAPFTSQLDNLYYNNFLVNPSKQVGYNEATAYSMQRAATGYVGQYDLSISGNINDRVYLGLALGLRDVHYEGRALYTERLVNSSNASIGSVEVEDIRRVTGTGVDARIGAIFRPIAGSPFRFGVSIATPVLYDLNTDNTTTLFNHTNITGYNNRNNTSNGYGFKVVTPWKFGASIGHTMGGFLALGASYEYADYGATDTRVNEEGSYYDGFYSHYYESSYSDKAMNRHTKETLKGVSTLKLGAEAKLSSAVAVRAGYNYVSALYNKNGFKNGGLDSYGSNYSTATDYINWGATNRFTLGLGYSGKHFNIDLAYQYSAVTGDFYPFMAFSVDKYNGKDGAGNVITQHITGDNTQTKVHNNRHQVLLTLGYRF